MAEVGDIVGHLRIDTSAWQQGLRQAEQQLAQFAQQITRLTGQLSQFSTAFQQAFAQNQQGLAALPQRAQQASQSFQQFNTQVNQTNQAFTVVNQTVQQFNTHLAATTNNVNNVRQGLQQAQGAASGFGSVWQGALSVAGGLGIVTSISGIVSGLKSLATESLQAAARIENLRAQFTALQGAAQGAITLQGLFQTAQRLGVEFGTLATAFRQFDAATRGTSLEGERARRVFEQITTGMRGMGTSSEQVGRALLALQQMVSKGTVSQEELRQQLGEALPGAMGIAARAFGVTTQEMNKMIEKGMDASQFVLAFGNQVEREFGGKAATATNTLTGAWQRFSNELEQFSGALAGSTLVATLRDLANSATTLLETLRKGREERERAAGGAAPVLPRDAGLSPVIQARQAEIDRLAQRIEALQTGQLLPGVGQFLTPMIERLGNERRQLIEAQNKAAAEFQRRLQGEAGAYEGAIDPVQASADRMIKIVEEGQKRLREIDLQGAFLNPLEQAEQKTKAWEETTKKLGDEWNRIGEGLRRTLIPTGKTTPFDEMLTRIAGEKGLDPNLMRALVEQESGFDPTARSRAGAMGLMQLMPGTARQLGVPAGREFDPETNLRAGMTYFAQLLQQFNGNVERALTAYNAGPGRGGIPLPTGENATFARDVLRRIPQGPGEIMQQAQRQQEALRLGVEAEQPDLERRRQTFEIGREQHRVIEAEMRAAEQARQKAEREAAQEQEQYQAAIDKTRMALAQQQDTAVQSLTRMQEAYRHTTEGQERLTAARLAAQFPENEQIQTLAASVIALSEEAEATKESFNAIKQRTDALREASDAQDAFQQKLDQAEARLRAPREEREEVKLRGEAAAQGIELTPAQEQQLQGLTRLRQEQERLNQATEIWRDLAFGIGRAWSQLFQTLLTPAEDRVDRVQLASTRERLAEARERQRALQASHAAQLPERLSRAQEVQVQNARMSADASVRALQEQEAALLKVEEGTNRVAEAFKAMGQAILKTFADIAAQQATQAFFKLGLSILTGALTGGAGAGGAGATTGSPANAGTFIGQTLAPQYGFDLTGLQHGGVINAPTMALLGEGPSSTLPEYVMNKGQMDALMTRGAASGQQSQVIVNNFPSRQAAEEDAARQRGQGFQVVVNAVLDELGTGESSRINRALRALQR